MQTISELEILLKAAKKNERLIEQEEQKKRNELRKKFFNTRPYILKVTTRGILSVSNWIQVQVQEMIYISRKINLNTYNAFIHNLVLSDQNILSPEELTKAAGMQYYLTTDGIIHNTGGGTLILKTPQLCSQSEWEQIKSNNIPTKFLEEI